MSDYDDDFVERRYDEIVEAIRSVKEAVEQKTSTVGAVVFAVVCVGVFFLLDSAWHSKFRYSTQYSLPSSKIVIEKEPHDCNFWASPLGEKYCRYERVVQTVHWATSTTGEPIVSYDNGKTWTTFVPDTGQQVPQSKTLQSLIISWERKDD